MTSLPSAYTPLESLLLFQALRAEGCKTETFSFTRISEQLKSIPLVRNDPSYNEGRLSPDALRECYLRLVKEEAKRDHEQKHEKTNALTNGDASPGSRKRKAPSPTIPSVQEAAQWPHLVPRLVERLYTTYRDNAIRQIREHERNYDVLSREISEIEGGKWDERLQRQQTASATQSPKPSTTAHTQSIANRPDQVPSTQASIAGQAPPLKPAEAGTSAPPKRYSSATIEALMNHDPPPQHSSGGHRRTSSNTTLPPLSEMAPQSPRFGIPPKVSGSMPAHMPPHLQQQPSGLGYAHSPPTTHQSPYAPHHAHPIRSPQVQHSMSRPSSSPRPILPPPPGMQLPPPTPAQHAGSPSLRGPQPQLMPQQHYQTPHRASIGPSPANDRPPHNYSHQLPPPPGYYQQQPYQDRRISYPPLQGQPAPQYSPPPQHRGSYQLQPFQLDNSQPVKAQKQPYVQPHSQSQQTPKPQLTPAPLQRPPSYQQYHNAPATAPRPPPQPQSRLISDIVAALATPPRPHQKPLWKSERRPSPLPLPAAPSAPVVEPLSPVLQRPRSPSKLSRPTHDRATAIPREPTERKVESISVPALARKRQSQAGSPGSVASSGSGDHTHVRTRSQSVSDVVNARAPSDERPASRDQVKVEPSTPADVLDQPEQAIELSATPASGPMTRKRRGTLQSHPQPQSKRKRQQSPPTSDEKTYNAGSPPPRSATITATRSFNKVASAIMNDITSHKHASYFAGPVRNKDASGYTEIIKQPQHLKSIRAAITAGTRAIAAATSSLDSPSATPSASVSRAPDGSTTVELERTVDLIPPKAIVNGAQLEKEVYRMLANAVMFNPGEDGLVADTREMFEDVEAKIRDWRGAERDAGAVAVEEEDEGKGKRRKL